MCSEFVQQVELLLPVSTCDTVAKIKRKIQDSRAHGGTISQGGCIEPGGSIGKRGEKKGVEQPKGRDRGGLHARCFVVM